MNPGESGLHKVVKLCYCKIHVYMQHFRPGIPSDLNLSCTMGCSSMSSCRLTLFEVFAMVDQNVLLKLGYTYVFIPAANRLKMLLHSVVCSFCINIGLFIRNSAFVFIRVGVDGWAEQITALF